MVNVDKYKIQIVVVYFEYYNFKSIIFFKYRVLLDYFIQNEQKEIWQKIGNIYLQCSLLV